MNIIWLEWLGYLASLIVLISLLMSSVLKLRWINLIGSAIFSTYGFLIGSYPVGIMNLATCTINIYYLVKIYGSKEYFKLLPTESNSTYFNYFLDFYNITSEKFENLSKLDISKCEIILFVLRNMIPASIFIASEYEENTLKIELDFAIPEYRDFKIGTFIFEDSKDYFLEKGYSKFISFTTVDSHIHYLKKMGFEEKNENDKKYFIKSIIY